MNKQVIVATLVFATSVFACKQAPDGVKAKTSEVKEGSNTEPSKTLNIDVTKSSLAWIGTKVTAHHAGKVNIKSGQLLLNGNALTGGMFVIDMPTLIANNLDEKTNTMLTGHLMSPDFFDVTKYPEAKFEITGVKPFSGSVVTDNTENEISIYKVSDPNVIINGNLTIKDVTKNIEFPAKVSESELEVTAIAKFMIDRTEWGITYKGMSDDLVRNDIWFGVSLTAN